MPLFIYTKFKFPDFFNHIFGKASSNSFYLLSLSYPIIKTTVTVGYLVLKQRK